MLAILHPHACSGRTATKSQGRQSNKTKQKEDTVRGAIDADGNFVYGYASPKGLVELEHTTKGHLRPTRVVRIDVPDEDLRKVARWKGQVVGIAESFFPDPNEWRFEGLDKPLDKIDVRSLTYHRALLVRSIDGTDRPCRCCQHRRETILHLGSYE